MEFSWSKAKGTEKNVILREVTGACYDSISDDAHHLAEFKLYESVTDIFM